MAAGSAGSASTASIDGVLTLSTPTGIAADRIKRDYVEAIMMAAETAGVFVDRVVMTVRKR